MNTIDQSPFKAIGIDMVEEIFTPKEVSLMLKINVRTLQQMIYTGKIKAFCVNANTERKRNYWRFKKRDIDEFIKKNTFS